MDELLINFYGVIANRLSSFFRCDSASITIRKRYNEGFSGSNVLLVNIPDAFDPKYVGDYVLKVSNISLQNEIENTKSARRTTNSGFFIIPELLYSTNDDQSCYLYDLAGNDLISSITFRQMEHGQRVTRIRDFLQHLCEEWFGTISFRTISLYEMIRNWLGENRFDANSRLCERVNTLISDNLAPYYSYMGSTFPNPIFFLCNNEGCLSKGQAIIRNSPHGKLHGDMNLNNIIVQPKTRSEGYEYYLIDFDQYKAEAPIFFDNAYILFCLLIEDISPIGLEGWIERLSAFFNEEIDFAHNGEYQKYSVNKYMIECADAIERFINHQQEHNRPSAKLQWLASNVAVGLNFVNKRSTSEIQQTFAFLFSSIALKIILKIIGEAVPNRGDFSVLNDGVSQNMNETWKKIDGFSIVNRYVLITSCTKEAYSQDVLINLSPVHWNSIIEINGIAGNNELRSNVLPRFKATQGYRYISLSELKKSNDFNTLEVAPTWFSITVPSEQQNKKLFYNRSIHDQFIKALKFPLSFREKEPTVVIVDPKLNDSQILDKVVEDIILSIGENTYIKIICLENADVSIDEDDYIKVLRADGSLSELAVCVHQYLNDNSENSEEICLPSIDGIARLPKVRALNISNDMTIVHRNILSNEKDDDGLSFYLGSEPSWHDVASQRDVIRFDYQNCWREIITRKLSSIASGSSTQVTLRHLAGGGGTTVARRLAWEICTSHPTVWLNCISEQTAERIKELYTICKKSILVIAEMSDGAITSEGIIKLRREMISKGSRALFFCITRITTSPNSRSDGAFYLADTPDMCMSQDEAESMQLCFMRRIDASTDVGQQRIRDLNALTHSQEFRTFRYPFFYGLYTYGQDYKAIASYVLHNKQNRGDNELCVLSILAVITSYSQSSCLLLNEVAVLLFPEDQSVLKREAAQEWIEGNPLVSRRGSGYRINHPIVADEVLQQCGYDVKQNSGRVALVELIIKYIDSMASYYGNDSMRMNDVYHELFTHREIIDENEPMKFSKLITTLKTRENAVSIVDHLCKVFYENPHYCNHLARIYLYSINPQERDSFPDVEKAKFFANQAIDRAKEKSGEGLGIHYHLLGKVYTQECYAKIQQLSRKNNSVSKIYGNVQLEYDLASQAFDMCMSHNQLEYGLTGKLELNVKTIACLLKYTTNSSIKSLLANRNQFSHTLQKMIADCGDYITQYINEFGITNMVFQRAYIRFYQVIDNKDAIERLLSDISKTPQERIETRRVIATMLLQDCFSDRGGYSYDRLSEEKLTRIYQLMNENIYKDPSNRKEDRIRWFEAFRRLKTFSLSIAYRFLLDWPDSNNDIYVCYYRYVLAFILYVKTGSVSYKDVRQHIQQCDSISRGLYGKSTTMTFDYVGMLDSDNDKSALVTHQLALAVDDGLEREQQHINYRKEYCTPFCGTVFNVQDRIVTLLFAPTSSQNETFYAKIPVSDSVSIFNEGEIFNFYIGFSYSGIRAWDIKK